MLGQSLYLLSLPLAGLLIGVLLFRRNASESFGETMRDGFRDFFAVIFFNPREHHRHNSHSSS
jgi:hypothetical protein